ncbi:type II toxin-antitoxin system PemK/MazF family toxin [Microlunatus sp. Y2014]|uniref:type II toxin-antitoxin system PemK/MazF family toxin n=1 Tax=Microlunatus sp. Y2014 TaxID=3418488 RepID=UPI003DA74248
MATRRIFSHILDAVVRVASKELRRSARRSSGRADRGRDGDDHDRRRRGRDGGSGTYAGDFTGVPQMSYDPEPDDRADPGEVVWGWVPYEEDHRQGKDRPVLVIGRNGELVLALQMTSQDHDRDAEQEASEGRYWFDIGTGSWDRQGRPSEVRTNRILQLHPDSIRREGGRVSQQVFDQVAAEVRRRN